MAKTIKEMIEVMKWFEGEGEVEYKEKGYDDWEKASHPSWNWYEYDYRIKEFQYPMWFKDNKTGSNLIVKFDSLQSGEVIVGNEVHNIGEYNDVWIKHTNKYHWEEIEEPIAKQKITIEKWLIEMDDIKVVVEASDIDSWLKPFPTTKKLKLIESYEVEI